ELPPHGGARLRHRDRDGGGVRGRLVRRRAESLPPSDAQRPAGSAAPARGARAGAAAGGPDLFDHARPHAREPRHGTTRGPELDLLRGSRADRLSAVPVLRGRGGPGPAARRPGSRCAGGGLPGGRTAPLRRRNQHAARSRPALTPRRNAVRVTAIRIARAALPGAVAVVLAAAGAAAGAQPLEPGRVLVAPFETEGEPRAAWLGEGVAILLAVDLAEL